MAENQGIKIRGSGSQHLGNWRDKHLHFLDIAPAQREHPDFGIAWAISEWTDFSLKPLALASKIAARKSPRLLMRWTVRLGCGDPLNQILLLGFGLRPDGKCIE